MKKFKRIFKAFTMLTASAMMLGSFSQAVYAEVVSIGLSYGNLAENETISEEYASLIATSNDFEGEQMLYVDDYKVDVQKTANGTELIVYDIPSTDITKPGAVEAGKVRLNTAKYMFGSIDAPTYAELYSDYSLSTVMDTGNHITIRYFVKNQLPVSWGDVSKTKSILDANAERRYDIAQYIYDNITPGDIDNDGDLSVSDSSVILEAYARNAAGEQIPLNMTMFDFDGDEKITIADATAVLKAYAENAAGLR